MIPLIDFKKCSGIYRIENSSNGKLYIGSAVDLYARVGAHIRALRRNGHVNQKLQRAWNTYGESSFIFSVIEKVEDKALLIQREQFWIDHHDASRNGYNIVPAAGSLLGFKHSEETKEKMRIAGKAKIVSEEARTNLSIANTGKKMSEHAKSKMREAKLGKKRNPHSDETRLKMSLSAKGRIFSEATLERMSAAATARVVTLETREKMSAAQRQRRSVKPKPSQTESA